jgi:HlyD family secretion protein
VNEADVGGISRGNPVTFTVDAIPGRVFHGQVGQVRLNATMTQNVVTYTVEVDTDNSDGALLPYLTANAKFEVGRRNGVFLVPNAALHWWPRAGQVAPGAEQLVHARRPDETGQSAIIWGVQGGLVRPIPVKTGLTDGGSTEVEGPALTEGLDAVVGEYAQDGGAAHEATRSPFTPQIFRGGRRDQSQPEQTTPPSISEQPSAKAGR